MDADTQRTKQEPKQQRELNFDRSGRLRICDYIELPGSIVVITEKSGNRQTVSGSACAQVLRAIESCRGKSESTVVGIREIATRAKVSEVVAGRAINALSAEASYVLVDGQPSSFHILAVFHRPSQRGRLASRYKPIWGNAVEFVPPEKRPANYRDEGAANPHGTSANPHHDPANPHGEGTVTASLNRSYKPPPPPPPIDGSQLAAEAEVKKRLSSWKDPLAQLHDHAIPSGETLLIVKLFDRLIHIEAVKAGALYHRLMATYPGQPVMDGWPIEAKAIRAALDRELYKRVDAMQPHDVQELLERCVELEPNIRGLCDHAEKNGWQVTPELRPNLVKALRFLEGQVTAEAAQ